MSLMERVTQDLTASMKAQDAARTSVLRMAKAALKNREIDKRAPLDEAEALKVLQSLVKQREDASAQFRQAGRDELAVKEEAEIAVLRGYLPRQASDEQLAQAVEQALVETGATSARDMGKVMKAASAALQAAGQPVDGKRLSEAVRARLGG